MLHNIRFANFVKRAANMYKGNKKYTNGEITVFWQPALCIHATTCYRELIEVFNPRKRPWVNMNGAPTEEIIRVVKMCPTQALSFKYNHEIENGQGAEETSETTETPITVNGPVAEVRVMKDGPLVLKGSFDFIDSEGHKTERKGIISVCRCGESNDMPFCDGMHRKRGFEGD